MNSGWHDTCTVRIKVILAMSIIHWNIIGCHTNSHRYPQWWRNRSICDLSLSGWKVNLLGNKENQDKEIWCLVIAGTIPKVFVEPKLQEWCLARPCINLVWSIGLFVMKIQNHTKSWWTKQDARLLACHIKFEYNSIDGVNNWQIVMNIKESQISGT